MKKRSEHHNKSAISWDYQLQRYWNQGPLECKVLITQLRKSEREVIFQNKSNGFYKIILHYHFKWRMWCAEGRIASGHYITNDFKKVRRYAKYVKEGWKRANHWSADECSS